MKPTFNFPIFDLDSTSGHVALYFENKLEIDLSDDPKTQSYRHVSVLFEDAVEILGLLPGSTAVDCTLGGGGHTSLMLEKVGPTGRVVAFDRDLTAIHQAKRRFAKELAGGQLILIHSPFGEIELQLEQRGLARRVNAILADIGVSSHHLDEADRGFSFNHDGPLDMRMDQSQGFSAAEFLQTAAEEQIAKVIWQYGDEPKSRFIAKLICERRDSTPFTRTGQLANLIAAKVFYKEASRKHPATRTFQALRIHVNNELGELESLLFGAKTVVAPGGVLAIISFHSLEDRIVKETMQELSGKTARASMPRDIPLTAVQLHELAKSEGTIIKPFPVTPSDLEISHNPRARSAKLRAIRFF